MNELGLWFVQNMEEDGKLQRFSSLPLSCQLDEYLKASRREARKLTGRDIYEVDPLMSSYLKLGRDKKFEFNLKNNCFFWAAGSLLHGFNRISLGSGQVLCPHPGDTLGVPFLYLNGRPTDTFSYLSTLDHLCQIDGLKPLSVGVNDPLPVTGTDERLVAMVLFRKPDGMDGVHFTVRSAGADYFTHKPGRFLPPSLLDYHGNLVTDPRKAALGETTTPWMFFTAPQNGLTYRIEPEADAAVRLLTGTKQATPEDRQGAIAVVSRVVERRAPDLALQLRTPN